jgi:hypothetical protein
VACSGTALAFLKEFIDSLSTALELVRPEQHGLLKFVKNEITGEAR